MTKREKLAKELSHKTVKITLKEAKNLPYLIGKIVVAHFLFEDYCALNIDGINTYFIKK